MREKKAGTNSLHVQGGIMERKGQQIGTKEWRNPSLGCDEWGVFDASVKFFPDNQVIPVEVNGVSATLVGFTI